MQNDAPANVTFGRVCGAPELGLAEVHVIDYMEGEGGLRMLSVERPDAELRHAVRAVEKVQGCIVGQRGAQHTPAIQNGEFGVPREEVVALLLRNTGQTAQVRLGDELI